MFSKLDAAKRIPVLNRFVGRSQIAAMGELCYGEERQFFIDKICELADLFAHKMAKTYEQDGKGNDAIVYLHYFHASGADWYITERDIEDEQNQAYGLADLGYGAELGYISIEELKSVGAELDIHWTPKTLGAVRVKTG